MHDLNDRSAATIAASIPDRLADRLVAVRVDLLDDGTGDLCAAIADTSPVVWSHRVVYPITADVASGPTDETAPGTTYGWCTVARRVELAALVDSVRAVAERDSVRATVATLEPFGTRWGLTGRAARTEWNDPEMSHPYDHQAGA